MDSEEGVYHDEVEIEDFEYDEDTETYYYPCPCGDKFEIAKVSVVEIIVDNSNENDGNKVNYCERACVMYCLWADDLCISDLSPLFCWRFQ